MPLPVPVAIKVLFGAPKADSRFQAFSWWTKPGYFVLKSAKKSWPLAPWRKGRPIWTKGPFSQRDSSSAKRETSPAKRVSDGSKPVTKKWRRPVRISRARREGSIVVRLWLQWPSFARRTPRRYGSPPRDSPRQRAQRTYAHVALVLRAGRHP